MGSSDVPDLHTKLSRKRQREVNWDNRHPKDPPPLLPTGEEKEAPLPLPASDDQPQEAPTDGAVTSSASQDGIHSPRQPQEAPTGGGELSPGSGSETNQNDSFLSIKEGGSSSATSLSGAGRPLPLLATITENSVPNQAPTGGGALSPGIGPETNQNDIFLSTQEGGSSSATSPPGAGRPLPLLATITESSVPNQATTGGGALSPGIGWETNQNDNFLYTQEGGSSSATSPPGAGRPLPILAGGGTTTESPIQNQAPSGGVTFLTHEPTLGLGGSSSKSPPPPPPARPIPLAGAASSSSQRNPSESMESPENVKEEEQKDYYILGCQESAARTAHLQAEIDHLRDVIQQQAATNRDLEAEIAQLRAVPSSRVHNHRLGDFTGGQPPPPIPGIFFDLPTHLNTLFWEERKRERLCPSLSGAAPCPCPRGRHCGFAHSQEELLPTGICPLFVAGRCRRGAGCLFRHYLCRQRGGLDGYSSSL